ncbi:hypothetical protein, partial [Acinetobacter baumannii]|uniref:hypothetical protein n=1 Tax=Acinetobacter baumannii TaxID=470 RepID=UPI001C0A1814
RSSGISVAIDNHSASPWQSIPQEAQNLGWRGLEYCNAPTSPGRIHMIPLDLAAETPTHPILFELSDFARSIVDGSCRPYRRLAEA